MEGPSILVAAFTLAFFISGIESTNFIIKNNCPYTIWPAALSNSNSPRIGNTGFALGHGGSSTVGAPSGWARVASGPVPSAAPTGRFGCPIGDCGTGQVSCNGNGGANPASLAEFQLNGFSNNDFYDVSLIDGFNLPVTIAPQNGACPRPSCSVDINSICPSNLAVRLSNGAVVGCRSDPQLFKARCPDAYANPPDPDTKSCPSGTDYNINRASIINDRFILQNECPFTIWPATETSANSPAFDNTGFTLIQGFSSVIDVPSRWNGRLWARTLCATDSAGRFGCSVGDCATGNISCSGNSGSPPYSLVEFSLNDPSNQDFYDVSLVDGFNLPVVVTPSDGACSAAGCPKDINSVCRGRRRVVACNSGCSSAGGCTDPSDFTVVFKSQCPQTFTYSTDPATNTFTCASGGDYFVTFCVSTTPAQPQYIGMICAD
ncbi:LOW QUALITY PROTEIN: hypothetical protein V2J09_010644 [Rumex salicifolius]